MAEVLSLKVPLSVAEQDVLLRNFIANHCSNPENFSTYTLLKRSIDARKKEIVIHLQVQVYFKEETAKSYEFEHSFVTQNVKNSPEIGIIGTGPAGLFAALRLVELGLKPVLFERGKDVRSRRRDLALLTREHIVNPNSNYCFGEGGAGTYSDGKLYTRSGKRGSIRRILERFYQFGADEAILIESHPHIGTNKLPAIIAAIRTYLLECGAEIHFETSLKSISNESGRLTSIKTSDGNNHKLHAVILATGHSARDVFQLLKDSNVYLEYKGFALGVRIEHPQHVIDQIQYHCSDRGHYLPAASYSLVEQIQGRGVYSFCMCPGGIIAPCATSPGEIVTNGWSPSKRNNPYANSGIVVPVELSDIADFSKHEALAGVHFQASVEQKAWALAGKSQAAPAQRYVDFINGKPSTALPRCSYQPGIVPVSLNEVLPTFIHTRLKEALKIFGKKLPGFIHPEAVLVAPESRTSSPLRIKRDHETGMSVNCEGLFPCGEGAGYAGGIVSAAMDGENIADKVAAFVNRKQ